MPQVRSACPQQLHTALLLRHVAIVMSLSRHHICGCASIASFVLGLHVCCCQHLRTFSLFLMTESHATGNRTGEQGT